MTYPLVLTLAAVLAMQGTVLEIRTVEGEGAVELAGSRGAALTIEVTDGVGKPVSGAVVSVRLPDEGPSGVFANGMVSDIIVTGTDGRASTSPIRWNRLPGTVQIRITVVKDRLRAGSMTMRRTIDGGTRSPALLAPELRNEPTIEAPRSRSKWLKIGLIAGGAAGVGFAVGIAASGKSSSSSSNPGGVGIGAPSISITKP